MTARVVLRKRIPFRKDVAELIESRNRGDKDSDQNAIREFAELFPHLVKKQIEKLAEKYDLSTLEAVGSEPEFFSVWGLALRKNPKSPGNLDKKTNTIIPEWVEGKDPVSVRQRLLRPEDILTEVTRGKGRGDLITQPELNSEEAKSVGVDIVLEPVKGSNATQFWGTEKSNAPTFGTARDAMRLIGADWVQNEFHPADNRDGANINVVVVDTGMSENYIRSLVSGLEFGGGFVDMVDGRPEPGMFFEPKKAVHTGHGNMIARNILRIAPSVRIFDAPLLPPRVRDIEQFTDAVEHLFEGIREERNLSPYSHEPWMIVNAWAVENSIQELHINEPPVNFSPSTLYTSGAMHSTNKLIQNMSHDFAIVFAAGNNGQFEPSPSAGIYNRGPYRGIAAENGRPHGSITGANALPGVLTVGACNVNGNWIGGSSQGNGPDALMNLGTDDPRGKPDLVAPSWFCETHDRHQTNTGTSAACAVAAGLAASAWGNQPHLPPQALWNEMRQAALSRENENAPSYRERMGYGIVQYPF